MKTLPIRLVVCLFAVLCVTLQSPAWGQAGYNDDRVMLQGFYWESYRHGCPDKFPDFGDKKWYDIVREKAGTIQEGRFNLIWLPPPSYAGEWSAGYNPKEYFNFSNSYGDSGQHRAMLVELLEKGIEPVADLVLNHRDGSKGWADFRNPDWDTTTITRDDEAFTNSASEVYETALEQRGAAEENPGEYAPHGGTTYQYGSFRDIDHTNPKVRRDLIRYLLALKSMGYRGWRYDMVHGYHAKWVAVYNKATEPTFSVGEFDWDKHDWQRGWIWETATTPDDLTTASSVFDFTSYFTLKNNKGNYRALYAYGNGLGMMGDNTDGQPWKNKSVTFVENHDTGYRTKEDRSAEPGHEMDSFLNDWQVEQAYAYILTHPGVPTVFWKHYFDWGTDLRERIKALINARKAAGVHAGSVLYTQDNAQLRGVYAARVDGRHGKLYIRIGGSDQEWHPAHSGYSGYRDYAHGNGWAVWVALDGNPEVQQAPLAGAFPVPQVRQPQDIDVPDSLID